VTPLRALVIGAGPAATALHMPTLARLRDGGQLVLALVCDIDSGRAAAAQRRFGFLEAGSDALAATGRTDLDVAYVLGSAQLHHACGLAALRSGKHLFVEKPIAPCYAQACELAQAGLDAGRIAAAGHNRRFYRSLAAVRARAGNAGWRMAEAVFHKPELALPPPFGARTWLGANGIHALDALVFMMGGLPEQVFALAGGLGTSPGAFSALLRWRDGAQGLFACNNEAGSRREEYVFHAPGQTLTVRESGLTIEADGRQQKLPLPMQGDGIEAEHAAFLQAVRTGVQPCHSIQAIAPSLYLAECIEAGHCGDLPAPNRHVVTRPAARLPERSQPAPATGKLVLVVKPAELQLPLARSLSQWQLISLEDVEKSPQPLPEVAGVILGRGAAALPPQILAKLPALRVVGIVGLSVARHEPEALLARGIVLVNASSAYAHSVAEFALGLAILGRRCAFYSHELMRRGGWGTRPRLPGWRGTFTRTVTKLVPALRACGLEPALRGAWRRARPALGVAPTPVAQGRELRNATIGLLGWSANAQAFCARCLAAGARVVVYSEHAEAAAIGAAGARAVSLAEALAADVVSLHRGLSSRTRHFLGAAELARLRPGALLLNVARGALIEPEALLARLKIGDIFACLDTYSEEPPAASHPLRRLPNVFLTSHIAGGSPDMHAAAAEEVVQKVAAYLAGDPGEVITAARLRTMS
jgi:phosphoglycerate dehydrogenase-like enzyme/predicted dehydrogenase